MKTLTLGIALAFACSGYAGQTYTVRNGDTVSGIAGRLHVKQKALLHANGLTPESRLKLGMTLNVPTGTSVSTLTKLSRRTPGELVPGTVVAKEGDNDTNLAKRNGLTPHELRVMNPGVNWRKLQIGQVVRVGHSTQVARAGKAAITSINPIIAAHIALGSHSAPLRLASAKSTANKISTYTVRSGDNDWLIAKRTGTTPKSIRLANPTVAWSKLKPGQVLRLPTGSKSAGSIVAAKKTKSPFLRAGYALVMGDNVALRRGASKDTPLVARVDSGTHIKVLAVQSGWVKARFPKGTSAWVRSDFIQPTSAPQIVRPSKRHLMASRRARHRFATSTGRLAKLPSTGIDLLDKANSFRGVRYHYGSASRSSTDCSGFTSQVFRAKGVKLPRTSGQQSKVGATVSRSSLKAGDLVFFRTGRARRINHVGIYMGQGKFIHASSGGGKVQVNNLNEGYYQKRFATAKRVARVVPTKKSKAHLQAKAEPQPAVTKPIANEPAESAAPTPDRNPGN